jgi:hypothetical protein
MSDKEVITCIVSDHLHHKLSRYELREGLKQTGVYDRASDYFIAWYASQTPEQLKTWRVLSSSQGGHPYRGRVPSESKAQMQRIAQELRHPLLDVYYTALSMLIESEEVEKTHLVNGFLDHMLFEHCEQQVHNHHDDRSTFVQKACVDYVKWHKSKNRPESYEIPLSTYTGHEYRAYVNESVHKKLTKLAQAQGVSIIDVYQAALVHHAHGSEKEPTHVVTALIPKDTHKLISAYIQDGQMPPDKFLTAACDTFLEWYESASRPKDWEPYPALLDGQVFRAHVPLRVATQLHALPHPRPDVYAHALRYYAHVRDIDSAPYLFDDEDEDSSTATGGMAKVLIFAEQDALIRMYMVMKRMRTLNDFCTQAVEWWLARRRKMDSNEEEYFSRLYPAKDDPKDSYVHIHVSTPYEIHSALQAYAREDKQSLRTAYYNAIVRYMDHVLDLDDLSKFVEKMK